MKVISITHISVWKAERQRGRVLTRVGFISEHFWPCSGKQKLEATAGCVYVSPARAFTVYTN